MVAYPQIRTSADVLKSTIRVETLIPFLKQQQAKACAIVNSTLYGLLPFWYAMKKAHIHAVVGLNIQVQFEEGIQLPLILYAQNQQGYKNLLKISSAIEIRSDQQLPFRWLQAYGQGCIAVIPAFVEQSVWLQQQSQQWAQQLQQLFQSHLYVGIARYGCPLDDEERAIQLSEQLNCSIIALYESTFLQKDDHFAYEVARAIERGHHTEPLLHVATNNQYVLTNAEWYQLYADRLEWLDQTEKLLQSCHVSLQQQRFMPKFPVAQGQTAERYLQQLAVEGLCQRLQVITLPMHYAQRLHHELQIICEMGFADYFLIVEDFMRYAREQAILTGPGRGSSASSLVAYALQITQVDPLTYDLLFERFLNPERVSLPDIDIDFIDTRRHEVITYVAKKYGQQYVAQIITFGTLSAKAVARDVARMFQFERADIEVIAKMIPNKLGISLQEAYEQSTQLQQWIAQEDVRQRWFDTSLKLEGLPRNSSTHAAGVVLSPVPLVEVIPIEQGHDGIYLTQWPMQEVEQSGLLKMDFLGLRNLTMLEQIRRSIAFSHQHTIDFQKIPLDDAKTFALLREGDTTGVFQLESEGMRDALRAIQPTEFLDIVAVNALYRPGPMDFIPTYARRKQGQEQVTIPHKVLEPILQETYGVIIYQEQIMKIAHEFAGFTVGEADLLRRAVSKKNRERLEAERHRFVIGAKQNGYEEHVATEIYAFIERFAQYGFPKSHSVAYSMISYQLAYFKANYPINFYASLLTQATGNQEKLTKILYEAKARGIRILPPSIQKSMRYFKVENGQIRFSLSAIKGVAQPFLKRLIEVRTEQQQVCTNLFDLAMLLNKNHFHKPSIEALIKAGALDEFGQHRATLLATIEAALKHMEIMMINDDNSNASLPFVFGIPKYNKVKPLTEWEQLQYEKEVLGLYLSEHPVVKHRQHFHVNATVEQLATLAKETYVKFFGIIEAMRVIRTKKGEQMAFLELQDEFGQASVTLFPQEFQKVHEQLELYKYAYVEGYIEHRQRTVQLKVRQIRIYLHSAEDSYFDK